MVKILSIILVSLIAIQFVLAEGEGEEAPPAEEKKPEDAEAPAEEKKEEPEADPETVQKFITELQKALNDKKDEGAAFTDANNAKGNGMLTQKEYNAAVGICDEKPDENKEACQFIKEVIPTGKWGGQVEETVITTVTVPVDQDGNPIKEGEGEGEQKPAEDGEQQQQEEPVKEEEPAKEEGGEPEPTEGGEAPPA